MPRTKGAKDKNPRKRREMTDGERKSRKKKKQAITQQLKAQSFFAPRQKQGEPQKQDDEPHMSELCEPEPNNDGTADEGSDVIYEEIQAHDCHGSSDLGQILASLDDESELTNEGGESVMKTYMKAIMGRFKLEDSPDFRKKHPEDYEWLQEFLKDHEFWIRSESARVICRKLKIPFGERAYYRDVRVWFPDFEGGQLCTPVCPTCKRQTTVRPHSYPLDHPGRRVVTFNSDYYLMSRQYLCRACEQENKDRKQRANGKEFEKVQYTMMGDHDEVLKHLPGDMDYRFPAVLTHRAALDRALVASLRPLMDRGLRPEGISDFLLELHSNRYMEDYLSYELILERDRAIMPSLKRPMFSKFDDRKQYNGAVPTGSYISEVRKRIHRDIRPHLNRETKKISLEYLSIDASAKAPKKLSQYNGKRIYETLQTVKNELGQTRLQVLAGSDSHEQLEPALKAMVNTIKEHGKSEPTLAFSDNPVRDKSFLLDNISRLQETQAKLDHLAAQLNSRLPEDICADVEPPPPPPLVHLTDNESLSERVQVIPPEAINSKIDALREQMENAYNTGAVYAFDLEWDTTPTTNGNGRKKTGRVALMQIGYRLDGAIRALLLQLPRNREFPYRLLSFLQDRKALFVGFNISNDLQILQTDFNLPDLRNDVRHCSLGMMARQRDFVQRGNHSCEDIVQWMLGYKMDKSIEVRCSKWSRISLSDRQRLYAALDVIKPLEVYEKLLTMPDLSTRLNTYRATPGIEVDIVPPHARNDRQRAEKGYRVGDLATRAAIGKIVDGDRVVNRTGLSPLHAKTNAHTRLVEISEVLAPFLIVPGHKMESRQRNKQPACLEDFGSTPFKIILPLTMLREHIVDAEVRTYQQQPLPWTQNRITPPAPAKEKPANKASCQGWNVESDDEDESDSEWEGDHTDHHNSPDLCSIRSDDDDDDNDDGGDALQQDASQGIQQVHLETISQAELVARLVLKEGNTELLYCDQLDTPPDSIDQVFSCVLGDVFHAMDRAKVPVKHEYKKAYFVALRRAFFSWDETRLGQVTAKLKEHGWTDYNVESTLYYRPSFFRERVERIVLPPRELYWRVRAVYVKFGHKTDTKTGQPLFSKAAWKKANNLLKEILLGLYSDPPGFNFYSFQLGQDGEPKRDKNGINLLHCCRGTNAVENGHKHYSTAFRYTAGFELGDCLLDERRHRDNVRKAERRIPDHPRLGMFDTWKMDRLQILVEKNHGIVLFALSWVNGSDYRDTDESCVTVAIHSEELDVALQSQSQHIDADTLKGFSSDLQFLCHQQGVPIPFLPVHGKAEYQLFTHMLLFDVKTFNDVEMSMKWIEHVDAKVIFPKLPYMLRKYYKQWERNRRVQNAVEKMKSEIEILEALNKECMPPELQANGNDPNDLGFLCDDHTDYEVVIPIEDAPILTFPRATLPASIERPAQQALRPFNELGGLYVGLERIGDNPYLLQLPPLPCYRGMRGPDREKRTTRRCGLCVRCGNDDETARQCPGRGERKLCLHFTAEGNRK